MKPDQNKTSITPAIRLQAFAMMSLASQQYYECRKLERAVSKLLGGDGLWAPGTMTDMLYARDDDGILTEATFDEALLNSGFVVEPDSIADDANGMIAALNGADEARTDPIFNDAAALIAKLRDENAALRLKPSS